LQSFTEGELDAHSPPDTAPCDACLAELCSPSDRRYRYPFINCTDCGPRLTIVRELPYDRKNTSMACFPLCPCCRQEYESAGDRRFHAEPNACPECGPALSLYDASGRQIDCSDPLKTAAEKVRAGAVIALKGMGGFHLCADAGHDAAVKLLRERKGREEKPFAVMVRDLEHAGRIAHIDPAEQALLLSPQRPIVLLRKKDGGPLSGFVAPGMPNLGVMLPSTPVHHLLLQEPFAALIMTSGNRTDEPICTGNREALQRLRGIADFFIVHNRDILVRCDDSIGIVVQNKPSILRRARGYAPRPLILNEPLPGVLALGAHLKSTLCVIKDNRAFLSPHIGNMDTPRARDFFHETISLMEKITGSSPETIAADFHPGYYSTAAAEGMGRSQVVRVQHHHAHIVSCMAENRISGKVIGLAMDGTGYGADGHIWGGEFFIADEAEFTRAGHLKYVMLPGADRAIHEPWRTGVSLLRHACGEGWAAAAKGLGILPDKKQLDLLEAAFARQINFPLTSSLGRVFDGATAIIGLRQNVSFEGQAAMELEGLAEESAGETLPYDIETEREMLVLNLLPAIGRLAEKRLAGTARSALASAFHATVGHALVSAAVKIRERAGCNRAVLSGGCFQNRKLLEQCIRGMREQGFEVFTHRLVPANDGGISLGQAVCAAVRSSRFKVHS